MTNKRLFLLSFIFLALLLTPCSVFALVMRENGPEAVIVQIKESLRTSDDLDSKLNELRALRQQERLNVEKWWAGNKLLVLISFPADFSQSRALAVIAKLRQAPAVEKVVAVSAFNLHFPSGDFAREFGPNEPSPTRRAEVSIASAGTGEPLPRLPRPFPTRMSRIV